ncbi:type I secretion system permease/ATPase [Inhella gelatinilytica]|uniref:type I secretion system permease/ATPase n=1 Tax=Inhella gelatinilytica TaxID=2795030 RepID=UPI002872EFD0|nr:type I secretion system permease/ATPase [Inhella gelatinilytica]
MSELREGLRAQSPLLARVAGYSLVTSLLFLAPTWYMLEVYDRVLNSRNETTLLMLTVMVVAAYVVMELLDVVRLRLLQQVGLNLDARLRLRLFDAAFRQQLRKQPGGSVQVFSDLRTLRDAAATPVVTALFDLPASLVFLVLVAAISPWLGVLAALGAALLGVIAWLTERYTMPMLMEANKASIEAQGYAGASLRNAQVIESMGMLGAIRLRWLKRQEGMLGNQAAASDRAGLNTAVSKMLQGLQGSLLLGASCWLTLQGDLAGGGGMMLVASILGGRVLTPLTQLVGQWRLVVNARDSWRRLDSLLAAVPEGQEGMELPPPKGQLSVEGVLAAAPGSQLPIIRGASFAVSPGEVVAVIGPSASGKTTLARLMVGLWPTLSGTVRLDGADVYGWPKEKLGPHLGYVPQGVELFDGTLAENIARFGKVDLEKVERAAAQVGLTEWVQSLPEGWETKLGEDGAVLSGGQRQRVALARAIYGDPSFIVMDEPNASLDEAGEKALVQLLLTLKARKATVVVITHRTAVLPACDKLLILRDGQVAAFGPRDEVMAQLNKAAQQGAAQAAQAAPKPGAAMAMPIKVGGAA